MYYYIVPVFVSVYQTQPHRLARALFAISVLAGPDPVAAIPLIMSVPNPHPYQWTLLTPSRILAVWLSIVTFERNRHKSW
ncbi:uncharacterized protein ColSpa_04503 [Colletotrichum spaethianum]|uniref:Uncharacterized protein n=1 Tax=Colletotrichum spaethianum TaxID=700344 RepID=A0AA37LHR3_9PEZI|nr:uncharacterized protein ColSpa_04503 [Colletotrichum spaethianum]GKT44322.1 hypothetical protein ColSpa_04503 [Colletotrichum spaethianum]